MSLPKDIVKEYNATRVAHDTSVICHAPFTNINFEQNGNATACCYNRKHVLGTYPQDKLMDLWFGDKAEELRQYIREDNLEGGCLLCKKQLLSKNYSGMRARGYDWGADRKPIALAKKALNKIQRGHFVQMPTSMEFELSNTCNLECVMCNGYFSSSIRKNREHAPALTNPYDEDFVQQLKPFLPYMRDARFLGGEPFLIDIYYRIWEEIAAINPGMRVHITTNATILNNRAKTLLDQLNCHIVMSMDSIVKETYEQIRINAKFDRVWEHLQYFLAYCRRKNTQMSMAVCPITLNWHEMADLVRFCNTEGIEVFFNTVYRPETYTLELLPSNKLVEVVAHMDEEEAKLPETTRLEKYNKNMYRDMANQVRAWLANSQSDEVVYVDEDGTYTNKKIDSILQELQNYALLGSIENKALVLELAQKLLFADFLESATESAPKNKEDFSNGLFKSLQQQLNAHEPPVFMRALMDAYLLFGLQYEPVGPDRIADLKEKLRMVEELALSHTQQRNIILETTRLKPRHFIDSAMDKSLEEARNAFVMYYGEG